MSNDKQAKTDTQILSDKIKDVRIAMLTTVEADGELHSRPMATQDLKAVAFDGDLWFFTRASAPKVGEVEQHQQVNVSYANPGDNLYVSVSGNAELVRDAKKIKDLWNPLYKAWFPDGLDDPELALLKVHVNNAEYWDAPSGKMGLLYTVTKGLLHKGEDSGGTDVKLNIN
jgi:general stress protein 26